MAIARLKLTFPQSAQHARWKHVTLLQKYKDFTILYNDSLRPSDAILVRFTVISDETVASWLPRRQTSKVKWATTMRCEERGGQEERKWLNEQYEPTQEWHLVALAPQWNRDCTPQTVIERDRPMRSHPRPILIAIANEREANNYRACRKSLQCRPVSGPFLSAS
jgi:hypothetical protein